MASDAPKNIRISDRAGEVLQLLEDKGYFRNQIEAYRCAIALALALDLKPGDLSKLTQNKWDTASVFYDSTAPADSLLSVFGLGGDVRAGQGLAEEALDYIGQKLNAGDDLWPLLLGLE